MLEIRTESSQLRRKPHGKCFRHRSITINKQRVYTGNRLTFLWILVTLASFLTLKQGGLVCAGDDNYAAQADDGNVKNDDAAAAANGDDAAAAEESTDDAAAESNDDISSSSSAYENEQKQYQDADDDTFHWNQNIGFDGVSVMPLSCIN
jgi:hypothetical protein